MRWLLIGCWDVGVAFKNRAGSECMHALGCKKGVEFNWAKWLKKVWRFDLCWAYVSVKTSQQWDVFRLNLTAFGVSKPGLCALVADVIVSFAFVLRLSTTGWRWRWTRVWGRLLSQTCSRTPATTSRSPALRGTWADSDTASTPRRLLPSSSAGPRWTTRERPKPRSPSSCPRWTPGAASGASSTHRRNMSLLLSLVF